MVYRFRVISDESDDFFCDIEIKSSQTFYDLHYALVYEAEWDSSQLASFFLTDSKWHRKQEISLIDISGNTLLMDKTKLSVFLKKEKEHLLYVFDILADRSFYLKLEKIRELDEDDEDRDKTFPEIINGGGQFPPQILGSAKLIAAQKRDIFSEEDFDDKDLRGDDVYTEGKNDE